MWYALGLVTLPVALVSAAWRRHSQQWWGTGGVTGGRPYRHESTARKHGFRVKVGVTTEAKYHFTILREELRHALPKAIGLSREFQTGDRTFDDALYVVSDDAHLAATLRRDQSLRKALVALMKIPDVDRIECAYGKLWVACKRMAEDKAPALASRTVANLTVAAAALTTSQTGKPRAERDPFILRAMLLLSVSTGLLVSGVLGVMRFRLADWPPHPVDPEALLTPAVLCGAAVTLAMIAIALVALKRSARTHLVIAELMLSTGFGASVTAFWQLRDFNQEHDRAPAVAYERKVTSKRLVECRKCTTKYRLNVVDPKSPLVGETYDVRPREYGAARVGDVLTVYIRPGRLGYPWVERVKLPSER